MSRVAAAEPPTTTQTAARSALLRREILTRDPEIHARAGLDKATVAHYAALMRDGEVFPPLAVFDDGEKLYIADGFLRDAAAERAGLEVVLCEVRRGTRRDAQLLAIRANAGHGLRLSNEEKRRAITKLLKDPEWSRWSNRQIAKLAGAGHSLVGRMRDALRPETVGGPRLSVRGDGSVKQVRTDMHRKQPTSTARPPALAVPAADYKPPPNANYIGSWLYYLQRMTPEQLQRWCGIIKSRVSLSMLAEAVDVVMRETAAKAGQPE